MSISLPSSDPRSLSSFSMMNWSGPNTSEKSSSSSSANFCISMDERVRRMGLSGRTDDLEGIFFRVLPHSATCIERGKLVKSDGWNS